MVLLAFRSLPECVRAAPHMQGPFFKDNAIRVADLPPTAAGWGATGCVLCVLCE